MVRLERDAWSMVKYLRQAASGYAPPRPFGVVESHCMGSAASAAAEAWYGSRKGVPNTFGGAVYLTPKTGC